MDLLEASDVGAVEQVGWSSTRVEGARPEERIDAFVTMGGQRLRIASAGRSHAAVLKVV